MTHPAGPPPPDPAPRKRPLPPDPEPSSPQDGHASPIERGPLDGRSDSPPQPGRAGLACEACRMRKTRCVGYPVCTWCHHRGQSCVRGRNVQTSPLDSWGQQLLESVAQVKQDILSALGTTSGPREDAFSPVPRVVAAEGGTSEQRPVRSTFDWNHPSGNGAFSTLDPQQPIPSAESILTWNVWTEELANIPGTLIPSHNTSETERPAQSRGTADTSISRMKHLGGCFERSVLARHPVISPSRLRRHIFDVAESGGDWSAESCLVFLVGAIALRRLSNDLGISLSDHIGRPLPSYLQEIPQAPSAELFGTPQTTSTQGSTTAPEQLSDITSEIQDYDNVEKSIHLFTSSNPDCSSYRSVDAFLGHAAECRLRLSRLQHMWPVGFGQPLNVSVSRDARNRRLTLLILRACLGLAAA
ncbi:hypothetical protein B0T11DRAFT_333743 [Plectosphaerella cucumerina]|uniref:Zn(2)-C6 fungal-type domain-containing protein n=1 Tax=Plectosphaerella cucumerina TaxID=40658 RepID=A0A8K0T4R8_9PEZI|nr:hypothetical protein B0T11DRAFT_333743 [Plectosphaerella cucumerina]